MSPLCIFYPLMERYLATYIFCAVFLCGCLSSSRLLDSDHSTRKQEALVDAVVRDLVMESDMEEAELIELAEKKNEEIQTEKSSGR